MQPAIYVFLVLMVLTSINLIENFTNKIYDVDNPDTYSYIKKKKLTSTITTQMLMLFTINALAFIIKYNNHNAPIHIEIFFYLHVVVILIIYRIFLTYILKDYANGLETQMETYFNLDWVFASLIITSIIVLPIILYIANIYTAIMLYLVIILVEFFNSKFHLA